MTFRSRCRQLWSAISAAWRSLLEEGDLLGSDGRPSQSKLAAFTVMMFAWAHAWIGPEGLTAGHVTLIIFGLAGAFGRGPLMAAIGAWKGFTAFESRQETKRHTSKVEVTHRQIVERRDPEDGTEPSGRVPQIHGDD